MFNSININKGKTNKENNKWIAWVFSFIFIDNFSCEENKFHPNNICVFQQQVQWICLVLKVRYFDMSMY